MSYVYIPPTPETVRISRHELLGIQIRSGYSAVLLKSKIYDMNLWLNLAGFYGFVGDVIEINCMQWISTMPKGSLYGIVTIDGDDYEAVCPQNSIDRMMFCCSLSCISYERAVKLCAKIAAL